MAFSSALLTETQKVDGEHYFVASLALPGGTQLYAETGTPSTSQGQFRGLIEDWGTIRSGVRFGGDASLEFPVTTLDVIDHTRELSRLITGAQRRNVRGSAATIRLVSPQVSWADSWPAFVGVVDRIQRVKDLSFRFHLKPDDTALSRIFNSIPVERAYPGAPADVRARPLAKVFGRHDSQGLSGKGMVPAIRVDTATPLYNLAHGGLQACPRVYADGTATGGYTFQRSTRNGIYVSELLFEADPGLQVAITADVDGIGTVYDGSGSLETNPATQMARLLSAFVFEDATTGATYTSGAWPATHPNLDSTSWTAAAAYFTAMGLRGARAFHTEERTGLDVLNEWCRSCGFRPYWTDEGKLAVGFIDHRAGGGSYISDRWIRHPEIMSFRPDWHTAGIIDRLNVDAVLDAVSGQHQRKVTVPDLSAAGGGTGSLRLDWAEAVA
jgi:hypothetical protein